MIYKKYECGVAEGGGRQDSNWWGQLKVRVIYNYSDQNIRTNFSKECLRLNHLFLLQNPWYSILVQFLHVRLTPEVAVINKLQDGEVIILVNECRVHLKDTIENFLFPSLSVRILEPETL